MDDAVKLSRKYAEDLGRAVSPLDEALRRYGKTIGLDSSFVDETVDRGPFGFPSWAHISPTGRRPQGPEMQAIKRPKKVKDVAPHALSTWEFRQDFLQRVYAQKVHLVGQHYRGKLDQEVLGWKREGNMALLVAEPDNPVDMNAVMVLAWNDQAKHWHHVGYVRATEAALLRGKWTGDHKNAMVARFTSIPSNADGHRGGRNIELTLTGEVRTYPGYRL